MPAAGEWNLGGWSRGKRKECGDASPDSENLPQNKEGGFKVFVNVKEGGRFSSANPLKFVWVRERMVEGLPQYSSPLKMVFYQNNAGIQKLHCERV